MNHIALDSTPPWKPFTHWVIELNRIFRPVVPEFHFRPWDTVALEEALEIKQGDIILELGAWNLFTCIPFIHKAGHLDVTDSFTWEKSHLSNGLYFISKEQWMALTSQLPVKCWELDARELKVKEIYDKIYGCSVIEHIDEDEKALENIYRALKPGGIFAFTTDINIDAASPFVGCCRIYSLREIVGKVLKAGFIIDQPIAIDVPTVELLKVPHYVLSLRCVKPA